MHRKQIFILALGCFLMIIHLILYFPNVHTKYQKLQIEREKLVTDYSRSVQDAVKDREGTFQGVLLAWAAVSIVLIFGTGLSLWIYRKRKPAKPCN